MQKSKVTGFFVFIIALVMVGCSNQIIQQEPEMYTSSGSIAPYTQSSFEQYVDEIELGLMKLEYFTEPVTKSKWML